jgi:hypothetical protein
MAKPLGDNLTLQTGKPPAGLTPNPNVLPKANYSGQKKVRIVLEDNDNIPPTGQFFGHNGRTYMVQSGVEVDVPMGIIDILNNAVTTVPIIDPKSLQVVGFRHRQRLPYRMVAPVPVPAEAA